MTPKDGKPKGKRLAAQASKMKWQEFVLPGDGRKAKAVALKTKAMFMECLRAGNDYTGADITLGWKHFAEFVGSEDSAARYLERLHRLMLVWAERDAEGMRTKKWKHGTIVRQASLMFRDIPARVRAILTADAATCVEGDAEFDAAIAMLSTPHICEVNTADSEDSDSQRRRLEQSTPHHDAMQPARIEPPVIKEPPVLPTSRKDSAAPDGAGGDAYGREEGRPVPVQPAGAASPPQDAELQTAIQRHLGEQKPGTACPWDDKGKAAIARLVAQHGHARVLETWKRYVQNKNFTGLRFPLTAFEREYEQYNGERHQAAVDAQRAAIASDPEAFMSEEQKDLQRAEGMIMGNGRQSFAETVEDFFNEIYETLQDPEYHEQRMRLLAKYPEQIAAMWAAEKSRL